MSGTQKYIKFEQDKNPCGCINLTACAKSASKGFKPDDRVLLER
ncbi:hypothetical protein [uncultured Campylobacter sp.]|nr:hypothetical protein [uncultured Campylobacter sp.]